VAGGHHHQQARPLARGERFEEGGGERLAAAGGPLDVEGDAVEAGGLDRVDLLERGLE